MNNLVQSKEAPKLNKSDQINLSVSGFHFLKKIKAIKRSGSKIHVELTLKISSRGYKGFFTECQNYCPFIAF